MNGKALEGKKDQKKEETMQQYKSNINDHQLLNTGRAYSTLKLERALKMGMRVLWECPITKEETCCFHEQKQ